jgi:hypothetical protein
VVGQRLSHHDPIPRIAVRPGKCCGGRRVGKRELQRFDAGSLEAAQQALGQGRPSPQSLLVGYFVSNTGPDEDAVFNG